MEGILISVLINKLGYERSTYCQSFGQSVSGGGQAYGYLCHTIECCGQLDD